MQIRRMPAGRIFSSFCPIVLPSRLKIRRRAEQWGQNDEGVVSLSTDRMTVTLPAMIKNSLPRRRFFNLLLAGLAVMASVSAQSAHAQNPWVVYPGGEGPGKGKHIVFVAAEESYRSEESMPLMARILSRHHGFKCTVLFAIDPADGTINPVVKDNIPGLEALETADLLVAFFRWRELPDDQMKRIVDYTESGKPIIGIRNATHPFRYAKRPDSPYARFDSGSKNPPGGWGRLVLGETWVSHYGKNLVESTRCDVAPGAAEHPILRGVPKSFWLPDDVYGISDSLQGDVTPLLLGQPLAGWNADDKPVSEKKPIPIAWTKTYTGAAGKPARIFTSTMGHGDVFKIADFRRLFVNACFWSLNMESQIVPTLKVDLVGSYDPGPVGAKGLKKGIRPPDLQ